MTEKNVVLPIAKTDAFLGVLPGMANRHGLIAGATGTGKTVTLRVLAEHFSDLGVPVFLADIKGDLATMCEPGGDHAKVAERAAELGLERFEYTGFPVVFWDVFGKNGHPVRTTVSEMGPLLLSRLLELNEIQSGVLTLAFRVADDEGLLLSDLKDLQAMLAWVSENSKDLRSVYGNVSAASVGAIQRRLLTLEEQGADELFGEPFLNIDDLIQTDSRGRGVINVLDAQQLFYSPQVYATLLLWMLSELFENLPEVGDPDKPRLVFFIDEAHLLFEDAPKALVKKIEQVARLIRSKGVGIYFCTQSPSDLPDRVLGQLGNRVQHALRAYTPREQDAVRAAAAHFRANPELDVFEVIGELGVGEALVSFLDEEGIPGVVQRALILPPRSKLGTLDFATRSRIINDSVLYGHYEKEIDPESAYEMLIERRKEMQRAAEEAKEEKERQREEQRLKREEQRADRRMYRRRSNRQGFFETFAKSAIRSVGYRLGGKIVRGILGSILK